MVYKVKCDCSERIETEINSIKQFEFFKEFFQEQISKEIFKDIPVQKPISFLDDNNEIVNSSYPDKWYKCQKCGCVWAFKYPDFPAKGMIYKLNEHGEKCCRLQKIYPHEIMDKK